MYVSTLVAAELHTSCTSGERPHSSRGSDESSVEQSKSILAFLPAAKALRCSNSFVDC